MLKKLVKYGNSNALILDRAILELLNIGEGAVVKLQTDGKSLIITPEKSSTINDISMSGYEMLYHSIEERVKKHQSEVQIDPVKNKQTQDWMPGTENGIKLQQAYGVIINKYHDDLIKMNNEEFLKASDALAEKYKGDKSSDAFLKEFMALRAEHFPNLLNMDKEMKEMTKQLGMPDFSNGLPELTQK